MAEKGKKLHLKNCASLVLNLGPGGVKYNPSADIYFFKRVIFFRTRVQRIAGVTFNIVFLFTKKVVIFLSY